MDTNRLKRFATEARNKLKFGIAAKITTLGFDQKGRVPESLIPQLMQGGSLWNGGLQTEAYYHQWMSLYDRVQKKGINEVYEEAAYTWFNRLVAIRILQKNGLIAPVMEYADTARTPRIVDEARQGRYPQMPEQMRSRLVELLDDDTKVTEQFALLISAWCHQNPIIQACFGGIADYTELLLPNNILAEGQFVDMLNALGEREQSELARSAEREEGRAKPNHTEFITDEDFRSPELIGWLYQFYISERKDEVFAKKGKFEADEIPAATQIFTPNWIVKYMVQNTIGRIYLDNNPSAAAEFKPKWKYLVEPSEPTPKESIYKFNELTELLTGDLACGSGHILNECFDLLYDLYIYEGYSRKEAIENIFFCNLRGIDLDTRAKQLATFALLLKACQKDSSFADAHILPHVLSMPTPIAQEKVGEYLQKFFRETPSRQQLSDLTSAFELMQDADSLGSIMKFDVTESTLLSIQQTLNYWRHEQFVPEEVGEVMPAMELILTLTDKYAALVMNPPYMGSGNMNPTLSKYVKDNYEEGKADLATVFVEMMPTHLNFGGKYAFIIPPSWMFLSTFENLRRDIIHNQNINSLLHLSRGVFGADFGASSAILTKYSQGGNNSFPVREQTGPSVGISDVTKPKQTGTYFRLIERTFQEFEQSHLCMLFEQTLANHDFKFKFSNYEKSDTTLLHSEDGNKIYYPNVEQRNFEKIPGCPIGYWVNENVIRAFENEKLGSVGDPRSGIMSGNTSLFTRYWHEVNEQKIGFGLSESQQIRQSQKKWFPIVAGGYARRWYGNLDTVINMYNDGEDIINTSVNYRLRDAIYYFKESITWPKICSGITTFRLCPQGVLFGDSGLNLFLNEDVSPYLALLNSNVAQYFLKIINPTFNNQVSDIGNIPVTTLSANDEVKKICNDSVSISKQDWDSHETSWDFEENPLVALRNEKVQSGGLETSFSLSSLVSDFEAQWEQRFHQLHENEEELNRQFIEIYGLQDELTPDVPLDEITILQQGEITIENGQMEWHVDVLMKQLVSYAVGVWMGRYELGKKGLHIAHPNPTDRELQEYWYGGERVYIDDDAIIPILPQNSPFEDNLVSRIADFIRITFGEERLTENLNYIEQQLGQSIEQYLMKDFWKDHKRMYQNRPIYWLFSSKKGAFKCLTYMHRMDAYTAERIRAKYLLPYIEYLQNQIADLENRASQLSTTENRRLQNLQKTLDECREYHERLQVVAEQAISFDLDDGVVVNYAKFGDVLAKLK